MSYAPPVSRLISAAQRESVKTGHGIGIALVVAARLKMDRSVLVRQCDVKDSAHSNSLAIAFSMIAGSATSSRIFTDQVVPMVRPLNASGAGVNSVCGHARTVNTASNPAPRKPSAVQSRRSQWSAEPVARTLLLFDIDGTLVSGATDAHRDAMHEALRVVHSVDPTRRLHRPLVPAGRTDPDRTAPW